MAKSTSTAKETEDVVQLMAESYTALQASVVMGVTRSRLAGMRCAGEGPSYLKAEKKIWYPKKWLHEYMQRRVRIIRPESHKRVA